LFDNVNKHKNYLYSTEIYCDFPQCIMLQHQHGYLQITNIYQLFITDSENRKLYFVIVNIKLQWWSNNLCGQNATSSFSSATKATFHK